MLGTTCIYRVFVIILYNYMFQFKLEMGSEEEEMERLIAYPKTTLSKA